MFRASRARSRSSSAHARSDLSPARAGCRAEARSSFVQLQRSTAVSRVVVPTANRCRSFPR